MGAGRPELWRPEHPLECTVVHDRDELIKQLAAVLVVSDARRSGDPQTRVRLDHYLPSVGAPHGSAVRWRVYTPRHRLNGVPGPEPARSEWHRADAAKSVGCSRSTYATQTVWLPSCPDTSWIPTSSPRGRKRGAAARI